MRTKTKARLSLIASLGVSLVAVLAASISTYAWFQASSAASITTSGDSVDISVAAPDDIDFANAPSIYAYNDNFTLSNGVYNNHGYHSDAVTNKVSMLWEKNEGSSYFYSHYEGSQGVGGYYATATPTQTRIQPGHAMTIIPEAGFTISSVQFVTCGDSNAKWIAEDFTWTNVTTATKVDTTHATLTPTDGTKRITTVIPAGKTLRITSVTINYTVGESTTWDLAKAEYAYCGDNLDAYSSSTNKASTMAWVSSNTPAVITRDFYELNSAAKKTALLSTSKLAPGYKMTFAIKAVASSNVSTASFFIEKYKSTRMMNRIKMTNTTTRSGYVIAIDEAIKIYGSVNSSGWYFGSGVNRFTGFDYSDSPDIVSYDSSDVYGNIQYNTYDSAGNNHAWTRKEIGSADGFNSSTVYFFFTIEFSDEDTTYYTEYNKVGADATVLSRAGDDYKIEKTYNANYRYYSYSEGTYSLSSPQPANVSQVTATDHYIAKERYFVQGTSGNSNCYEGLGFQINRIKLELT